MRHETGHILIARGQINLDDVRARLEKKVGKENIDEAARLYVFPPYNESQSDANEIATRVAHREDVKTGYKRIVSYHGNFYLIEKFDSSDLGYQIVEQLTKKQYYEYIKEYGNGENIAEQSSKESSSTIDSLNTERDWVRRGEYSATSSPVGQRGENIQVQRVGENKIEGRQDTGNRDGGLRGSFSNKQKCSRELDAEYLSAVNRGDTEAAQKMVDEAVSTEGKASRDISDDDYKNFGWVRDKNIVSAGHWKSFTTNFADAVAKKILFQ